MSKINIVEIVNWCADEHILVEKLQSFGVVPTEVICSKCGNQMKLSFRGDKKPDWRCGSYYTNETNERVRCNQKISMKALTIFKNARLDFQQILIAIHEYCNYSEVRKMCLEASIESSKTAAKWNAFFNEIVINSCIHHSTAIGER